MLILNEEEMSNKHLTTGLITSIDADKLIIGAFRESILANG